MLLIKAFLLGMKEFKDSITTGFNNPKILLAYEWGREWAHRLTFRYYDNF